MHACVYVCLYYMHAYVHVYVFMYYAHIYMFFFFFCVGSAIMGFSILPQKNLYKTPHICGKKYPLHIQVESIYTIRLKILLQNISTKISPPNGPYYYLFRKKNKRLIFEHHYEIFVYCFHTRLGAVLPGFAFDSSWLSWRIKY